MTIRPKPFLLDQVATPRSFSRAGAPAFFDPCRQILVPATPEELVRQQLIAYLTGHLGVPRHLIRTEVHVIHLSAAAGGRGRVDVVVYGRDQRPMVLLECKAPHVPLSDDTLEQVLRYHGATGATARVIATTNGHETRWYRLSPTGQPSQILHAPHFEDLIGGGLPADMAPKEYPARPDARKIPTQTLRWLFSEGVLGEGSSTAHHGYLANIAGLLLLERNPPPRYSRPSWFAVEQSGIRSTSFGNAAGGQWTGSYRYFLIKDGSGDAQIISLSVLGTMLVRDHPKFGNTAGRTMLIVAVDDFEKRHNSLQLDLDRFVDVSEGTMTIWHDGTLTRGKRGAAPRAEVIAYVRERAPHLVTGPRIQLGTLPLHTRISWQDAEEFLGNTIEYAIVRDQFRREAG